MKNRRLFTLLTLLAALPVALCASQEERPNIILIMADDMGLKTSKPVFRMFLYVN